MKPLEGITVIELSTYFASSACGRALVAQGARVIKVESPAGDPNRTFGRVFNNPVTPDENPLFDTYNGGKEFVCLDLKKAEDMEKFLKLLAKADVFLTNNRTAALKKMGLDYPTLKEKFPRLIMANVSGYGEIGPMAAFPGYDVVTLWAQGGFLRDAMVEAEGSYPVYPPTGAGDIPVGTMLAGAISSCLYAREKTGKGDYTSISLYGAAMWMFSAMSTGTQYGYPWPRTRYQGSPVSVPYKTRDGEWFLTTIVDYDRYWKGYCEALGAEELMDNPRYNSQLATLDPDNRRDAVMEFEKFAIQKNCDEITEKLEEADITYAKLAHFKDNHSSPQALVNGYMVPHTYPSGKEVTLAQPCIYFESTGIPTECGIHKAVGADNEAIFAEFDL